MKVHYNYSFDPLGNIYGACGYKIGNHADLNFSSLCWDENGKHKKITCKNCKRTKVYKKYGKGRC